LFAKSGLMKRKCICDLYIYYRNKFLCFPAKTLFAKSGLMKRKCICDIISDHHSSILLVHCNYNIGRHLHQAEPRSLKFALHGDRTGSEEYSDNILQCVVCSRF
jgi:hypothetical protein